MNLKLPRYLFSVLLFLIASFLLVAHENSWINYSQQYFKIQVVKDGVYRVYASDLVSADVPVNLINANHIQIFSRE